MGAGMNKLILFIFAIASLGIWFGYTQEEEYTRVNTPAAAITTQVSSNTLDDVLEEARKTGKPVFLYFQSESCLWCRKFEKEVLPEKQVQEKLQSFISASVDVDMQRELVKKFNIYGTPTMVFLDPEGRERTRILGYADTDKFLRVLEFALSASLNKKE